MDDININVERKLSVEKIEKIISNIFNKSNETVINFDGCAAKAIEFKKLALAICEAEDIYDPI